MKCYVTGYAVIQFPETLLSLYQSFRRRWSAKKAATPEAQNEKKVTGRSFQGYKDAQLLNQLIYEIRANNEESVVSLSTEPNVEGYAGSNTTVMEILSRTIARMDVLEAKVSQSTLEMGDT